MGIGLPLLSTLTVSQFRAVLAHEFAHYYGGDTSLGPWVYKTKSSMIRVFENIGSIGELVRIAILGVMYVVVTSVLKWYFVGFLRAINFISRRQEFRADELACLVAGSENLIEGLRTIHGTGIAWPSYWKSEVAPLLGEGKLVAISDGFTRFLRVPGISTAIEKSLTERLEKEKTEPYDTHPPLRDRIAAAKKFSDSRLHRISVPRLPSSKTHNLRRLDFVEQCVPDIVSGSLQYVHWDDVGRPGHDSVVAELCRGIRG